MGFWSDKRIVVTGGAGFLGSAVCSLLRERGAGDLVVPRSAEFDLTTAPGTSALFDRARPDVVIHLAARVGGIGANMAHPADIYVSNVLMGTHLIEEARRRGTPKTVIVGTICSYPKFAPAPFKEESFWDGYPEETNAPYGIAKKALLVHAQANRAQYGQNCIYVVPTNLYGPGDKFHPDVSHVIPALIKRCDDAVRDRSARIVVWGTGRATREFLHVRDAARGIVEAAEHYEGADLVNLGSGEELSIEELVELIARLTGFEGELEWDTGKPDGQPRRLVDSSRARSAFGFTTSIPLEDGLRETIEWYRANREIATLAAF